MNGEGANDVRLGIWPGPPPSHRPHETFHRPRARRLGPKVGSNHAEGHARPGDWRGHDCDVAVAGITSVDVLTHRPTTETKLVGWTLFLVGKSLLGRHVRFTWFYRKGVRIASPQNIPNKTERM